MRSYNFREVMEIVIKISCDGTLTLVRVVGQNQVLLQFDISMFSHFDVLILYRLNSSPSSPTLSPGLSEVPFKPPRATFTGKEFCKG